MKFIDLISILKFIKRNILKIIKSQVRVDQYYFFNYYI